MNAAKKIILLLWLVIVASLGNVSALTPGATENRVWQKSFAVLESRQAEPLQTPGLHQENESCGYELAPESLLAANKIAVPGHFGPHPEAYHQAVFDRLVNATRGLSGDAYSTALQGELGVLRTEASTQGTLLNDLLTGKK